MAVYSYNRSLFDGNNALDGSIDLVAESYLDSSYMLESLIDYEIDEMFIENGVYVTEGNDGKAVEQSDDSKPSDDKKEENNEKKKGGIIAKIKAFFKKILDFFRSFGRKVVEKVKEVNVADKALYEKYHTNVEKLKEYKWKHKYVNIEKYSDFENLLSHNEDAVNAKGRREGINAAEGRVAKRNANFDSKSALSLEKLCDEIVELPETGDNLKEKIKSMTDSYYSGYERQGRYGGNDEGVKKGKEDSFYTTNYTEETKEDKVFEMPLNKGDISSLNDIMKQGQGSELREVTASINALTEVIQKAEKAVDNITANDTDANIKRQGIADATGRCQKLFSKEITVLTRQYSQVYTLRRKLYIAMGRGDSKETEGTEGEDVNWEKNKHGISDEDYNKSKNESALWEEDLEDVAGDDEDIDPDDAYNDAEEAIDACGDTDTEESCLDLAFGF